MEGDGGGLASQTPGAGSAGHALHSSGGSGLQQQHSAGAVYDAAIKQQDDEQRHRKRDRLQGELDKLKAHSQNTLERLKVARKRVFASFLLLGMGMGVFNTALVQTIDYLSLQYKELYMFRLTSTVYTLGFLLMTIKYFFSGPPDKSNRARQRARLVHAYSLTLCVLVSPVLIDWLAHRLTRGQGIPRQQMNAVASVWVVATFLAGGAEGVISTVVFGEAAAVKGDRAAAYGKVLVSLLMPALRCMSKAAFPADLKDPSAANLAELRISATVHIVIAALILIACVVVTMFVIPRQIARVQAIKTLDVPPALTFQATLDTAVAAEQDSPEGEEARESMDAVGTLAAMVPASDGTFAQPMFRISRKGFSFKISRINDQSYGADNAAEGGGDGVAASNAASGAASARRQFGGTDRQQTLQRFLDTARGSMAPGRPARPSAGAAAGFHAVSSMVGRVESAPDAAAGLHAPSFHGYAPKRAFSTTASGAAGKDADVDVESPAEVEDGATANSRVVQAAITRGCSTHRLGSLSASNLAPGLVSGKWSGRWGSMRHRASMRHSGADVHVEVQPTGRQSMDAADAAAASSDVTAEGACRDQQLQQVVLSSVVAKWKRAALGKALPEAGGLSAIMERAESGVSDASGLSPLQAQQVSAKLAALDEGGVDVKLRMKVKCCWEAALAVWPFLTLSFLMPVINGQLVPLAFQRDYSQLAYGRPWDGLYFTQIVAFASVSGSFLGSLFVTTFKRKLQMLLMAAGMLLFGAAFLLSNYFEGGPAAKVFLMFFMTAYSGYLNSVAKMTCRTRSKAKERWVQLVLSMASATSFFVGNCLGWVWIRIKV